MTINTKVLKKRGCIHRYKLILSPLVVKDYHREFEMDDQPILLGCEKCKWTGKITFKDHLSK